MKKLISLFNLLVILFAAGALHAQTVSVDKTSVTLAAGAGGAAVTTTVNVTGSSTATNYLASSDQLGSGGTVTWLKVSSPTQTTPGTSVTGAVPGPLTIVGDPSSLATGTYTGRVRVFALPFSAAVSPDISVTLTVSPVGVSPSSFTFSFQLGSSTIPAAQTLNLTGSAIFTARAKTGPWLQVSPATGTSPGAVTLSLNTTAANGLTPGTYNDSVVLSIITGTTTTIEVPVTLTVTGAPVVTASPSPLSLNFQIGGSTGATNTPSQVVTLTNPGTSDLAFLITPSSTPAGWLTASPTSGIIPANGSIPVTASYTTSANLTANTYNGSLAIFVPGAATTQINVPVKLTVATAPLLNVPSATLAFSHQLNGSLPAAKSVTATSSAVAADSTTGQMPVIVQASTTTGGPWLIVPTTALTGTPFSVSVNPAGLTVGTYGGTITLTGVGAGNGPQTIPVTLTVSNDPLVVVSFGGCSTLTSACVLNFPIQTGAASNVTTQTIRVTSSTGAQATFTPTVSMAASAACGTAWLSIGVTAATTTNDVSIPVIVAPGSIASGTTCSGTISISGINPANSVALPNSPVTIPVNMYVSTSPMLAPPNPLALNFNLGTNATDSKSFSVSSTSSTNLDFTATTPTNAPWLFAGPTARNTGAGTNSVIVAVNTTGLNPGTYTSAVTITAAGALDSPLTVPVTLNVTAATMTVNPTSLSFSQTLGGANPAAKTFTVSTSSTDIIFTTNVSTQSGSGWLSASPAASTTTSANPATVTVNVDGSRLQPGTYTGAVTVTSASQFTQGSPAVVQVTLVVNPGTLSVTPANLSFSQVQGGTAPAAQKISVAGTPGALAFTVTTATNGNSGNWLSVSPASGNSPADVQVSVNSGTLAPGQYTGKVTVTSTGATGSPIDVPVTLTVVAAQTINISQATLAFTSVIGSSTAVPTQTVQVTSSGSGTSFTAAVQSTATWLSVSPANGTAPATLTVSVNPGSLAAGTYTGTISISSPAAATNPAATITVTLTVQAVPKPNFTAVSNAASYVNGPVSPGENIVIFGTGLGPADLTLGTVTNGAFDTLVANTQVFFDNTPAPIIYTRADQTSVMVPYGVAGRATTSIRVSFKGVTSDPIVYSVTSTAPGIYTLNQAGSGQGAILNQDFSVNAAAKPAAKGSVVSVYMTGEGVTSPASRDGVIAPVNGTGLFKPVQVVTATVGGVDASVQYYGSAPGILYGVMQVNVLIPANAPSGSVPIVIKVGSNSTQGGTSAVTIAVQ